MYIPMADGPPQSIEHRCLEYCYTRLGTSHHRSIYIDNAHIPNAIEHRSPLVLTSGGQIWQIYPRSASRCTPPVLTSSGQIWQIYPRSAGRCTPTNALWDIYYGMYLGAILDSSRKGGNFLLFLKNLWVNSQLAL